ncbi:spore gernimation protein [Bacillus thuringiensis serovar yunnanensis]|nr:spore gernimation protein [Bacillus thuringiensis serovar yunnanensis]
MKQIILYCILIPVLLLNGCSDQINIEDVTLTLILGLDLDENDNLKVYLSSPIFNEEAKIKEEHYGVKSITVRDSREKFDTMVMGLTSASKTQIILVGKRLLQQKNWADYLDPFYRDPLNTNTARIVAVDGPVSDIIYYGPKNKPRLPIYLKKLIDTAHQRNAIAKTTLQKFHNQTKEKGMTVSIPLIKKNKNLKLTGSVLLDEQNKYALAISPEENALLSIIQNNIRGQLLFTLAVPVRRDNTDKNWLSFMVEGIKVNTNVQYTNRFVFNTDIHMRIFISERLFPMSKNNTEPELEKKIKKQLNIKFKDLVKKIQNAQIDPIGLGLYARAYAYPNWKPIQNKWGSSLAKADVNVKVHVKITAMGTTK